MTRNRTRVLLTIVLGLVVVTAGCGAFGGAGGSDAGAEPTKVEDSLREGDGGDGGAGGSGDGDFAATGTPMATPEPRAAQDDGTTGGADGTTRQIALRDRKLIRTGHVQLEVEDFESARGNLTRTVNTYGGYVSDSSQERHRVENQTYTTGMVVLRVPAENFTAMMGQTEAAGTVLESRTNVEDVTEQLVDIKARLKNLRAQRDQLRELYRRANDTEDVLAVQRRLSDVQGEIERLEARQQNLRRQVALSTIRVRLEEPRPEPEPIDPDRWYEVGILSAFLESVNGVMITLRALVVSLAYILPYLLVFGVPVVAGLAVVWVRRGGWRP